MADIDKGTDPIVNLVANIAHYMYDPIEKDPEKARPLVRELWAQVMRGGISRSLTKAYIDRCSEGGFSVHYPGHNPTVLNWFIHRAPSLEWAEQEYKFSHGYMGHPQFRMAESEQPFRYGDGLVLCARRFINGIDLDTFFLGLSDQPEQYASLVETIGKDAMADLVFWQSDAHSKMNSLRPQPTQITEDLKSKLLLAFDHAREFGSAALTDEERALFSRSLNIFDTLKLEPPLVVPLADYCPKNIGVMTERPRPTIDEVVSSVVDRDRPDKEQIRSRISHWDPAMRWGHFLEDFFAFFDSYEYSPFSGGEGSANLEVLDTNLRGFLDLKYDADEQFHSWVDGLDLGWHKIDKLVKQLSPDRALIHLYRATRKADLSLTRYAWNNHVLGRTRDPTLYEATERLLPLQISFYEDRAVMAAKQLIRSHLPRDPNTTIGSSRGLENYRENVTCSLDQVRSIYDYCKGSDESMKLAYAFGIYYIMQRLAGRKIDYGRIAGASSPSKFLELSKGG
ncbi:MAG: hypothetical protein KKC75_05430 [Nanoarchaeota archaeon]|nr:hypothetical protein [Nanoarchaeota archaeon]MBU1005012.1 hypothetical protein [Nanoarchaeota archaeon]MBU1945904.1 hypothetical protein [Nanoarchaeota archaeon]